MIKRLTYRVFCDLSLSLSELNSSRKFSLAPDAGAQKLGPEGWGHLPRAGPRARPPGRSVARAGRTELRFFLPTPRGGGGHVQSLGLEQRKERRRSQA